MSESGEKNTRRGSVSGMGIPQGRWTQLTIPQLLYELRAALDEHGGLGSSHSVGRLLGTFIATIEPLLEVHHNRFSRINARQLSNTLVRHPAMSFELLAGGTFVDMGCGGLNPFPGMAVLIAAGAHRCIGIDLDELDQDLALRGLAKTAMQLIAEPALYLEQLAITGEQVRERLKSLDIRALEQGRRDALDGSPLEYRRVPAEQTGLEDDSVTGIRSNSFLEHVPDPAAVIGEMARITKPGGIGMHAIDGVDHRSYADRGIGALDFLSLDTEDGLVSGCNRVRPMDFVGLFESHGFEVVEHKVQRQQEVSEDDRDKMVEPYRSMSLEHLGVLGLRLFIRRPDPQRDGDASSTGT